MRVSIHELRVRGTPDIYLAAVELCKSGEPLKRARGIQILAQFGCMMKNPDGTHFDERLAIALELLSDETEFVINAAAWALAHMRGEKAVKGLLTVRHSASADIRHAVAVGLLGETSPEAVEALLVLMQDVDDDVRDWATFSLASEPISGPPVDSPQIRKALLDRLVDTCEDARLEAIWGLSIRKDPVGLRMLLERLEIGDRRSGDGDVAHYLFDLPYDASVSEICAGLRGLLADPK